MMAKRGADTELTRDSAEYLADVQDDEPSIGVQKADEAILATRKIKSLPRRGLRSAAPEPSPTISTVTETPAPSTTPKFGGFGGFGNSSTAPSFGSTTALAPTTSSFKSFTSSQPLFGSTSSTPAISPSASNATKTFASMLSSSSSSTLPSSSTSATRPTTNAKPAEADQAAVKYYTSLRGLNTSFLDAISRAIDKDPFMDLADVLAQYRKHRVLVQQEFDSTTKTSASVPSSAASSVTTNGTKPPAPPSKPFTFGSSIPSSSTPSSSMPVPPAAFSGFGNLSSASKPSSSSSGGGFVPSGGAPAAFSFGGSIVTKPAASTPPTTTDSANPKPSSGFQGFIPKASESSTDKSNPFLPTKDSSFSFSSSSTDKEKTTVVTEAPSNTSSLGGSSVGTTSNLFGGASDTTNPFAAPTTSDTKTGTFTSTNAGAGSTTGKPPVSSTFGGFGKPPSGAGSIGNPVGFGFGSPKADEGSTAEKSKSAFTFPSTGFSGFKGFGTQKTEAKGSAEEAGKEDSEGGGTTPVAEGTNGTNEDEGAASGPTSTADHDAEGAGEEDEETTFAVKAKLFKLSKDKEGAMKWADMGIGMLRLKKHKEKNKRRILLRNSSTGRIILNTYIRKDLMPKQEKQVVSFLGLDEQALPASYKIKVSNEASASELKGALEREMGLLDA